MRLPAIAFCTLTLCVGVQSHAQSPAQSSVASPGSPGNTAATPERYLLFVEVPVLSIYETPDLAALVIGRLEQGAEIEADQKKGNWYRIKRPSRDDGWIFNAATAVGSSFVVRPFPADQRFSGDKREAPIVDRNRPQGAPIEPQYPLIAPSRVPAPSALYRSDELPIPDRWRLVKALGLLPYNKLDPYNPNVIKGDLPVLQKALGNEWFFNLTAVSDTLLEGRRLPTPTGLQSSKTPGSNGTFGRGVQSTVAETGIISLALIKGDTTFRPPDYEFHFVPVVNLNRTVTQEVRAVNINPAQGTTRNDGYVGVQELFVDKHLRDVSPRYDFDSVRVGIQPFTADFRGFLFLDQPFGVRLFGTRDNNRVQYNAAWFRRLEKDTNSGLNDVGQRARADDIFVFNLYRQDTFVDGFTAQGLVLHNRNREGNRSDKYNANGFLERPAIFGTGRPHNYDVTYLGLSGDGHFGKWNVSGSAYRAMGTDERGMLSGRRERIGANFAALEVSRDFDWIRVRASGLYASGDKDPYDGKASGFDAVLENPQFAGADTSYWIRQSVPLIGGGGVALSMRNGVLPSLRTSREFGQSNFTNPGLRLFGIGADFDVKPQLRVISNLNYLEFDNLSSLAVLRNQRLHSVRLGVDASIGVQYRPFFTQNVVVNASLGALFPARGLREIYGNGLDSTQYSLLVNVLLTF